MAVTDLTLQVLALRLAAFIFIAAVHGLAVAAVTVAMGDPGARHDGRLSLNPLAHLDLVGMTSGVLFSVGWIRPVVIDPARLRPGRAGLALVVIAGAAATLASAVALRLLRPSILPLLPDTASVTAFTLIETIGELSAWFALVNLLPLPPVTGAHWLAVLAPGRAKAVAGTAPYARIALALAAASGIVTHVLEPGWQALARLVSGG